MALALKNVTAKPNVTTRTLIYTAPVTAGANATFFSGTISNLDDTNQAVQYVTFELEVSGVFYPIGNKMPVLYGVAPIFPKLVLKQGEKLHVTISTANMISVVLSVAERT